MNHAELVAAVAEKVKFSKQRALSKADVVAVIDSIAEVSQAELANGNEVVLNGIGKLATKTRAARKGRNPATGEEIDIPAKTVVDFSPAKTLRDAAG